MKELTTVEELEQFLEGDNVKVVDFYAEWCGPCRKFLQIADRVETALNDIGAEIAKVNVEVSTELKEKYGIKGIPHFIYFKNGASRAEHSGIKPIAQMQSIVNTVLDTNP